MIKRIIDNEYFRYLVAGGITTVISILSFYCLISVGMDYRIATIISFVLSASFAYFSNKVYVFKHKTNSAKEVFRDYLTFMTSRLFTLAVDFFGMILLVQYLHISELYSKILVNIIIFILNYIISKVLIFKK